MSSKIKIFAQIKYTMDEKHPNIKSVPKWYPGKIFTSAIHIPLTPIISMAWITLNHTLEMI